MAETAPLRRIAIDRGGTFTDIVAERADGSVEVLKLLSVDPGRYDDAAIEAVRRLTGIASGQLPEFDVRIGTTIATNALLERAGEPTLLAITRGFGDALTIGYQDRPDIFAREIKRPPPLAAQVVEIDERIGADGTVIRPLDLASAETALRAAFESGLRSVAIVLMHGWKYTEHEAKLAELAGSVGFSHISVSHQVAPLIRLVARGDTTVADAYLSPVLRRYVEGVERELGAPALFMRSSGGLVAGDKFSGKDALLSGPAGGIVGMAAAAKAAGEPRVVGFDMGGTSTDVSLYAGEYERRQEAVIGGTRVTAPMLRIDTVAAGGGSICGFDGGAFTVGPESAGAVPGPACYRRGGPLTITDCNLILGKLRPEHFPPMFGPDGDQPLDRDAAQSRLSELLDQVEAETGNRPDPYTAAEGLIAIAVASMANAIKAVSVARGHDPASYALMSFGGAGGQHACLIADALGMDRVLVHPLAGVLSAYGIALADRRGVRQVTLGVALEDETAWRDALDRLGADAWAELGMPPSQGETTVTLQLRYARTDHGIDVALGSVAEMSAAFEAAHRERFGFVGQDTLIVERVQVEAVLPTRPLVLKAPSSPQEPFRPSLSKPRPSPSVRQEGKNGPLRLPACGSRSGQASTGSGRTVWTETPLYKRETLATGTTIAGPALIIDPTSTVAVEPGWSAEPLIDGTLRLMRDGRAETAAADTKVDPVRLAIFAGLFMGVAEEMGSALQRSAASVNIRERLDFSCALFDAQGSLIANAPHIPVHLGSMGECVKSLMASHAMTPGDAFALNDPFKGGTHLPDVTVVQPVFDSHVAPAEAGAAGDDSTLPQTAPASAGATPLFFVAARGHHADIGGIAPGSMPADSRTIMDEGVILDDRIVAGGRFLETELRAKLSSGTHPARNIDQNVADISAQLAACARGASELQRLVAEQGADVVASYMAHVQDHAEALARRRIRELKDGAFAYETDDGAVVRVTARVDRAADTLTIDFTGTSEQRPGNTNAPYAVTRAAALYALRTLIDVDVPLNDGFLRPVTLIVPEGSMLNPRFPAAVVAGNVETSQIVTDALMGALGAMAGSQGTMNNFTFGDDALQYYETIAGGAGAGPGFAGASAVQTHMTNSRLTDPEVLETRYPVRLEEFSIRRGSGGAGQFAGGDGAVRRVRFLKAMRANILSDHRRIAPFGLAGGGDGATGINRIDRTDGSHEMLPGVGSADVGAGDVFTIETPGGGGYGASN